MQRRERRLRFCLIARPTWKNTESNVDSSGSGASTISVNLLLFDGVCINDGARDMSTGNGSSTGGTVSAGDGVRGGFLATFPGVCVRRPRRAQQVHQASSSTRWPSSDDSASWKWCVPAELARQKSCRGATLENVGFLSIASELTDYARSIRLHWRRLEGRPATVDVVYPGRLDDYSRS